MTRALVAVLILSLFAVACDDEPVANCVPDETAWEATIAPMVASYCGDCHAETPKFGAPISLVDYGAMITGVEGVRHVDLMTAQLEGGAMPPAGSPRPAQEILEAIARWSSCGEVGASDEEGVVVTAPPVRSPEDAPAGMDFFDVRADEFPVATTVRDLYQCFVVEAPIDEPRFIRRFEAVIDDERVLHHAVLLRDTERRAPTESHRCFDMPRGSDYLAAWAPGGNAFEFPEGGMRIEPGERFILQIHYNNRAEHEGVVDSSGLRIFHAPPGGPEYGMVSIGPLGFEIPARSTHDVTSFCTFREQTTFFASAPHMHENGSAFSEEIIRADGTREPLIALTGWDFDLQIPYHTPVTVEAGERIVTRCTFDNPSDRAVLNGPGTDDEMCFNFAYVTPPPPARYCDEPARAPREYEPGECAPVEGASPTPKAGSLSADTPPTLSGGDARDGLYEIEKIDLYLESLTTPVGVIDPAASRTSSVGQMRVDGGRMQADGYLEFSAVHAGGFSYDDGFGITFGGTWDQAMQEVAVECPAEDAGSTYNLMHEATENSIVLGMNVGGPSGPTFVRIYFTRVGD